MSLRYVNIPKEADMEGWEMLLIISVLGGPLMLVLFTLLFVVAVLISSAIFQVRLWISESAREEWESEKALAGALAAATKNRPWKAEERPAPQSRQKESSEFVYMVPDRTAQIESELRAIRQLITYQIAQQEDQTFVFIPLDKTHRFGQRDMGRHGG